MRIRSHFKTGSVRQSLSRNSIMSKAVWFTMGAAASYAFSVSLGYIVNRPKDLTQALPVSIQQLAPEWMSRAKKQRMGEFVFVSPDATKESAALVYPADGTGYPLVYFESQSGTGFVDSITMVDASRRTISASDEDGDGVFNSYVYMTDFRKNSMSFLDADMNGEYDHRFGPGREFAVFIDSKWHDVIIEGTERYVDIDGEQTKIEQVDRVWEIAK